MTWPWFTARGTIWTMADDQHSGKRHDGSTIVRHPDGYYVATDASGSEILKTKRWNEQPPLVNDNLLLAVDNNCPPRERKFRCGACKKRFSRPQQTLVSVFISNFSTVDHVCSETCGKKLME